MFAVRAVEVGCAQNRSAPHDPGNAQSQQHVRRTDDLYVESVSFMPPVVERCGGQHGAATPRCDKSAQRRTKSEYVHGVAPLFCIAAEGRPHDDPGRAESAQYRAKLDQQMRRGPEAVTANGFMPGNVPVKPGGNTHEAITLAQTSHGTASAR